MIDLQKISEQFIYDVKNPLVFNTGFFLFAFIIFFLIYLFIYKHKKLRTIYLLLFSLYFYYKSSGYFFSLVIVSAIVDYAVANWMFSTESPKERKFYLIISLSVNLGLLAYFKYTNFFIETINTFTSKTVEPMDIFLPIGISFYTFQTLSYTIDVYRKKLVPLDSFIDFAFYVSFFPQLVAGPIVRAKEFLPQINKDIIVTNENIGKAVYLIAGGLFKKAIIADYIALNFVDRVFDAPMQYSGIANLFAVYGYALQIYCDFSGYSDMAIGLALLLGFKLPDNFDSPYQSASITEFWRRWHKSLSRWLKDYLYISLGGNRKGKIRQYINLMLTMLLGGLWHGASWKFVFWGGMHGVGLAFHKWWVKYVPIKTNTFTRTIAVLITFHFVCLSWIFFRAQTFSDSILIIKNIIFFFNPALILPIIREYDTVFLLMIIGYFLHFMPRDIEKTSIIVLEKSPVVARIAVITGIIWLVMQVKYSDIQPFIYFQF